MSGNGSIMVCFSPLRELSQKGIYRFALYPIEYWEWSLWVASILYFVLSFKLLLICRVQKLLELQILWKYNILVHVNIYSGDKSSICILKMSIQISVCCLFKTFSRVPTHLPVLSTKSGEEGGGEEIPPKCRIFNLQDIFNPLQPQVTNEER